MKGKSILFTLALLFITGNIFSQYSPAIEWSRVTWAPRGVDGQTQSQESSGEDWWYSHKNAYINSSHAGYIACGYTSLVMVPETFSNAESMYNEGLAESCYNPIIAANYDYDNANSEQCWDRDYSGMERTPVRGKVALTDLQGNYSWYRVYCMGEILEVIQDGNYFYAIGSAENLKSYNKQSFLKYNPTTSNPNQTFNKALNPAITCGNYIRHMFIIKIDLSGNIIWQNLYGFADFNTLTPNDALYSESYGYDIIKKL
jgi:hypothetical protein